MNNKVKNIVIIVLIIIIVLMGGYLIYDKMSIKGDTLEPVNFNYKIVKTDKIGTTISHSDYPDFELEDSEGNLYLSYPVLEGNTNDIKKLNETIKKNINDNINDLNNVESLDEEDKGNCYWAKMDKSGRTIGYQHFIYLDYELIESDRYLTIIELEIWATECASGDRIIKNIYVVDKTNGRQINKNDIVNDSIISDYKNGVKKYIKENEDNDTELLDLLETELNNNEYFAFYSSNGNIVIAYEGLSTGNTSYLAFEFVNGDWKLFDLKV